MKKLAIVGLVSAALFGAATYSIAVQRDSDSALLREARKYFQPLPKEIPAPPDNPTTKEKVELGKMLYYDPRLSLSGVISCNTCHNLATYGVDNVETSLGHGFKTGGKNAPTVLNAGFHIAQFWDGRAKDLEEQAKGPILNPVEMAMPSPELVVERLKSIDEYVKAFKKAFPQDKDPVTYDNVAKAIAAFERTLVTPSRFDEFLRGNTKALTKTEKEGLKLFIEKGCVSCHNGVGLGGNMFQKFGIYKPYPYQDPEDLGRYNVTKNEADKYVYKVPSLRNVTRTYPYFHDGKVWDLREAVKIMGETQLGITLTEEEVAKIVAFLDSLTGRIPEHALKLPVLPPSSPNTPKPQK
ncbi:cytochrome-c peroxidase [Thermocrinis sp.]|jgi:cytochrome c peroxidase|uniref:cytochrome-c peroxidase n=1 Tax=Thermocrinis sp. TaxID=2024383 RepID=UPI0026276258|nr:cytochrome-c peroxidase [Thermocrinis sp.]